jgi:hypothetical protein
MEGQVNTGKKVCQQCNSEFEPKTKTGSFEQIYCSQKCRHTANNKRRADKIMSLENRYKDESQNTTTTSTGNGIIQGERAHTNIPIFGTSSHSDTNIYSILEKQYDAKIYAIEYKLKCEELERRYKQLEQENIRLQLKVEQYENEEEEEQSTGGFLGEILQNDMVKQALPLVLSKILK